MYIYVRGSKCSLLWSEGGRGQLACGLGKEDQRELAGALVSVSGMSPPEMGFTPSQLGPLFVLTSSPPGQSEGLPCCPLPAPGAQQSVMELNTASISWSRAEKGGWWTARRASLLLSWSGSEVKLLSSGAGGGPVPRLELLISPLGPAGPGALWPGASRSRAICAEHPALRLYLYPMPSRALFQSSDWIPPLLLWELIPQID